MSLANVVELAPKQDIIDADDGRVIIAFQLGKLFWDALPTAEYALPVINDIYHQWRTRPAWLAEVMARPSAYTSPLTRFIDDYVGHVEGNVDLPQDLREEMWFAHARSLAPEDHPINTSDPGYFGVDPGQG